MLWCAIVMSSLERGLERVTYLKGDAPDIICQNIKIYQRYQNIGYVYSCERLGELLCRLLKNIRSSLQQTAFHSEFSWWPFTGCVKESPNIEPERCSLRCMLLSHSICMSLGDHGTKRRYRMGYAPMCGITHVRYMQCALGHE